MSVDLVHADLTEKIISAYYEVYNTLGYGFLEKVYENAMRIALQKRGLAVAQQCPIQVLFDDQVVGEYFADLFVNDLVVIEIKAARELDEAHKSQLLNYITATNTPVGLLFNFGPKPQFTRKAMTMLKD